MNAFSIAPAARRELREIIGYIADESPASALKVRDAIFHAIRALTAQPGMGHTRTDITHLPVRFWTALGRFMIVYRQRAGGIDVVHVVAGGRDVAAILGD